jgi:hypothetical protein
MYKGLLHTQFDSVKPVSASITATWLLAATIATVHLRLSYFSILRFALGSAMYC